MSIVIAVAGPVGSGKSTLAAQLAAALQSTAWLDFDDYEQATGLTIDEIEGWLDNGADFNAIPAPGFAEDLVALKQDQAIVHPITGKQVLPQRFVVIEAPLARTQQAVMALIDFVVWIELPLDVALARKLRQLLVSAHTLPWLDGYLDNYLKVTRRLLLLQQQQVKPDAQLIVSGLDDPQTNVQQILQHLSAYV